MSKKNKKKFGSAQVKLPDGSVGSAFQDVKDGISSRGWKLIGFGIGIICLGFFVILFTDSQGQNWASNLCPFLLIGGYATIAFGIMAKERSEI